MVEDQHEFFAGGILVHNCIDAARYALEDERHAKSPLILPPAALRQAAMLPPRDRFAGVRATMVTRNRFARVG